MADQARWFKLWYSALGDSDLLALPPATRWAWAALGAHMKVHGTRGRLTVRLTDTVLAAAMGVTPEELFGVVNVLPHVSCELRNEEGSTHHGEFTVTFHNWVKYQEDSTRAERQRASRAKRRREETKKRGEEKRGEFPPVAPPGGARHEGRFTPPDPSSNGDEPNDQNATETTHDEGEEMPGDASWDAPEKREVPVEVLEELRGAVEVLEFLNAKTGRTYGGLASLHLIDARLREGWSVQQCKTMTMRKVRDWRADARMAPYLRPATLYARGKLEQYMAEIGYVRGPQP